MNLKQTALLFFLTGCGGVVGLDAGTQVVDATDAGTTVDSGVAATCVDTCAAAGATCAGDEAVTCARGADGCLVATRTVCTVGAEVCRDGACVVISGRQRGWADALMKTAEVIDANLGMAPQLGVDVDARVATLSDELFHLPDAPSSFYSTLRKLTLTWPVGHLTVLDPLRCGSNDHPFDATSTLGACTQPYGDHAVVSWVSPQNPLGLVAGDEVIGVDDLEGDAMMEASWLQPLCGSASASASNRRAVAGTSLFARAAIGTTVTIKHVDGAVEQKVVTALAPQAVSCRDPMGRAGAGVASSYLRPDGIGVIVVPRLHLGANAPPDFAQVYLQIQAQLLTAFDAVKTAPGIIWDLRANEGGSTLNGLEVVAGLSGAVIGRDVGGYRYRPPGSATLSPREAYTLRASPTFSYAGKVAFLIDGLTISASDYTALAVETASTAYLVGQPSSGSYGGGSTPITTASTPAISVYPDPFIGEDALGQPLEGRSAQPTHLVELEPTDLAAGRDTVMERAAALLLSPLPAPRR